MTLQAQTLGQRFTVGICASDSAAQLPALLSFLRAEYYGAAHLDKIVVVASGCPDRVLSSVLRLAESDPRVCLIVEPERQGKAEAINRILDSSSSDFLVMLNSDAFPTTGSIRNLLLMAGDDRVGAVSAEPVFEEGRGVFQRALALMWSAHSQMSLRLNHAGISNHGCDELIVVRRKLVSRLPNNVVNDGAYIGGVVRSRGFRVRFSTAARVNISVPRAPVELIRQRRRIIFGHVQVWKKLGNAPKTIESMLLMDPVISLRTIVKTMEERPHLLAAMPLLMVVESLSVLTGLIDAARSTERHTVWRRNAR